MRNKLIIFTSFMVMLSLLFVACSSDSKTAESENTAESKSESVSDEVLKSEESDKDLQAEEKVVIRIGAPKAPPILPVLRMVETNALGDNVEIKIDFWETPEQLIAMVQSGDHDMFAFPLTVISKLYNKDMGVKLTNVNTWGVNYFMSSDESVKTWSDLKGKTVYIPLQSSPPDIMTQYFLSEAGLEKDDYEIIYTTKTELAQMMIAGKVENATMLEPLASSVMAGNPDMKIVMSFEEEWQRIRNTDKKIPTAGFGVSDKFADEHHDLVVEFEKEYEQALLWTGENVEAASELAEEKLGFQKPVMMKAIPNMGLTYKSAKDSKSEMDDYYTLLFEFNPKTIGGKVPDEKMYFE